MENLVTLNLDNTIILESANILNSFLQKNYFFNDLI
ncbi:hypothetical protein HLPCO_001266 [Haloplasma contractile SSD-17B]|uniref:Uncharacterized protein n=1 Tax=Haloplasma contractile SSD-17B TaxID=1033810 RepID=F7Q1J5_9MOLU|nr:hypothetical protein HLPCO_001266 [Haloplasma contractile SSD-17B]